MKNDRLHENNNKNSLKLAPETMRIRDAIIEKYAETPLDILSGKLQALINDETDTGTKLGIFSARVEILRMRFAEIADKKYVKSNKLEEAADTDGDSEITEDDDDIKEGWMTLKILEASEVNGVRFPEGVKIDVHADDAKKLLEAKKAELISMKIEEATDNTTEANQSTDENPEEIEAIDGGDASVSNSSEEETQELDKEVEKGVKEDKAEDNPSLNPEEIEAIDSGDASVSNSSEEEIQELDKEVEKGVKEDKAEDNPSLNPEEIEAIDSGDASVSNSSEEEIQELDKEVGIKKNKS